MSWKTVYRPLTKEQKERGVIYSSMLVVRNRPEIDRTEHEVLESDPDRWQKIERLKDVRFFKNMARDFG